MASPVSMDADVEGFNLDDDCIVPWNDGAYYAGKITKILNPNTGLIQREPKKKNKICSTSFAVLRKREKVRRIPTSIIEDCINEDENFYRIHFTGWRSDNDEWLTASRILPYTPDNVTLMKEANDAFKKRLQAERERKKKLKEEQAEKRRTFTENGTEESKPKSKSRTNATVEEKEGEEDSDVNVAISPKRAKVILAPDSITEVSLKFPLLLKRLLVKDWELITKEHLLVQLPRNISVVQILREFKEEQIAENIRNDTSSEPSDGDIENLTKFTDSMATYFDYTLGVLLLYRFERNQYYAEFHDQPKSHPSTVYGGEHLLRLIVSMPGLLAKDTKIDDITIAYIVDKLNLLTQFIAHNHKRFLVGTSSYDKATRYYDSISTPKAATVPTTQAEEPALKKSGELNE